MLSALATLTMLLHNLTDTTCERERGCDEGPGLFPAPFGDTTCERE